MFCCKFIVNQNLQDKMQEYCDPRFLWDSYNSVPYRRLYPWTVRERPFYCLDAVGTGAATVNRSFQAN